MAAARESGAAASLGRADVSPAVAAAAAQSRARPQSAQKPGTATGPKLRRTPKAPGGAQAAHTEQHGATNHPWKRAGL